MRTELRKARPGDEKVIFDLVKAVLSDYGLKVNPGSTDKDISDLNKYYFENNGWFSVLEAEGKIIGSYGIFKIDELRCELRKMYLFNQYQGKGWGRLMLEDAIEKAKSLGYHEMLLETNKLLVRAMRLYQKYGFTEITNQHLSDRCDLAMSRQL